MITLFILGAFIGAGACLLVDLSATNQKLNDKVKQLEDKKENENICS